MAEDCPSPIDCNNVGDITPEIAFRKLIQTDENGCPALNTVEANRLAGSPIQCLEYVDCDMKEIDWQTLFYKMITTDENGCWALRVISNAPFVP